MGVKMSNTNPQGSWQTVYPSGEGNGKAWYLRWNGPLNETTGLVQSGTLYQSITPTWSFRQEYNSSLLSITRLSTNHPCRAVYNGTLCYKHKLYPPHQ